MTTLTQSARPGEYLMDDQDHNFTHDQITVALNQTLGVGQVIGKIAVGAATGVSAAVAGNTGNGTNALAGTVYLAGCQAGVYSAIFVAATRFEVFDPKGALVGVGTTGVAFATQIAFTITAGATPFAVGDGFTITITAGAPAGQVGAYDPAATDGRQFPAGVMFSPVTTTAATKQGVITVRSRRVNGKRLVWPAGFTAPQIATATAQLAAIGIIVRN
jgi:hypothetical protein